MRTYLTAAIALALLAGCSSEQAGSDVEAAKTSATTAMQDYSALDPTASSFAGPGRSALTSFASLPDRGELLAYQQGRTTKRSGAYTAYPVALSESHALNAIRSGEMVIEAPDGELVRLDYERHIEHPDGNWSWIGRNADGIDAVITFGEDAVFGTIPQGAADTLRLTMNAGRSWLVATDRSSALGAPGTDEPDYLIPPTAAAGASSSGPVTASAMRAESATTSAATAVIDVLAGYTNGLAAQLGSQSAAVTRMQNLATITNQAYDNSGVDMRIRLVGAVQVNYADNTDNGETLELLTGYESGEGPIDPDPAFDELRAQRDELGADLVVLVRAFRVPENGSCGIAWLLGGNLSGIDESYAPFGYSVVSDGTDLDESDDNTYFCRNETFAHELGHNMGQAHNEEDSDDPGLHEYSYGYRESSSTGFYTVMAYGQEDSDQVGIRHFANPDVDFDGRPTGTANADNARSLNLSMPIIAQFRDTVVPVQGQAASDIDGDGRSDLVWRSSRTGGNAIWNSANFSTQQSMTGVTNQAWKIVGTGDFNGDGEADILWRNLTTGANTIWRSGDSSSQQSVTTVPQLSWKVAGVGDFDGDGTADILWRNTSNGRNTIWRSGDFDDQQGMTTVTGQAWVVAGVGDFNGDGRSDVLWYETTSGDNTIWKSANSRTRQTVATVSDLAWRVVGVGDFNGDGESDIFWRNFSTGVNTIWLTGKRAVRQTVRTVNLSWNVAAIGDYDGDGRSDIFWRNVDTGANVYWEAGKYETQQSVTAVTDQAWQVKP